MRGLVFVLAIVVIVLCVWVQYQALNQIAFGRSMFISGMSLIMGLIVGQIPSVAASVVSVALLVIGFGMLIFMGIKSAQRLRKVRRRKAANLDS